MTWPQATDYNAAVQNPQVCFRDDDLRQGQVAGDLFGLPRPHSGNFADVYQIQAADNQSWAVKCFTRPVAGLHQRYQAISDHLHATQRAFMVEFRFLEEGVCIRGQWYPLVKMRWVEGFTLNEFVRQHLDKPVLLERLAQMWVRLAQELRDARMAHGDLQHGNVLLVPGSKSSSLALKLIDYDGMFVPALADVPSGEVGHPNYQHPQRLRDGAYDGEFDRFSQLLIYTALRCIHVGGADLWGRYDNLENMLFREGDFRRPRASRLLHELWSLKDRDARDLVGHLLLASQGPLLVVPSLDELVAEKVVRPLTGSEEAQVNALLGEAPPTTRKSRVLVPAQIGAANPETPALGVETAAAAVLVSTLAENGVTQTTMRLTPLEPTTPELPRVPAPPPLPPTARPGSAEVVAGEVAPAAAQGALDVTTLLDPVVSILSRPGWMAALAAVALVSFLLVNLLVWFFLRQPGATPVPPSRGPHLNYIEDVMLKGGQKREVLLQVERNDSIEPLEIQVDGLPAKMKPALPALAADQDTATLPLVAPLEYELPARDVIVSLWHGGHRIDEQPFRLSVRKVPRPSLVKEKLESIRCIAGQLFVFPVTVDARGCQEPFSVRFDDLPSGVLQKSLPGPAVELRVPLAAAPVKLHTVSLTLRVGELIADSAPLFFNIDKANPRVRLKRDKVPNSLSLQAGKTADVLVLVQRESYDGPVAIRFDGLPSGVTAMTRTISANGSFITLTIEAGAHVEPSRSRAKLLAVVEGKTIDEREIAVTVERASVPPPDKPAEKPVVLDDPTTVQFDTVDGVTLKGSLFPGPKRKKGACVLLVHDFGAGFHRKREEWKRLAVALQEAGHTVLTFDLRGHGDSTNVREPFWQQPDSQTLPAYLAFVRAPPPKKPRLPDVIHVRDFPPLYSITALLDIAAARMHLDKKHDDPKSPVNADNLIVIAAGQSAALSILWLDTECRRFVVSLPDIFGVVPPQEPVEGERVRAMISLSVDSWMGDRAHAVSVADWSREVGRDHNIPMLFLYGEKDFHSSNQADKMLRMLRKPLPPLTGKRAIGGTAGHGQQLLQAGLATEETIADYVTSVLKERGRPWAERRIRDRLSYWLAPNGRQFAAHRAGDPVLEPLPLPFLGFFVRSPQPPQPAAPRPGR